MPTEVGEGNRTGDISIDAKPPPCPLGKQGPSYKQTGPQWGPTSRKGTISPAGRRLCSTGRLLPWSEGLRAARVNPPLSHHWTVTCRPAQSLLGCTSTQLRAY